MSVQSPDGIPVVAWLLFFFFLPDLFGYNFFLLQQPFCYNFEFCFGNRFGYTFFLIHVLHIYAIPYHYSLTGHRLTITFFFSSVFVLAMNAVFYFTEEGVEVIG